MRPAAVLILASSAVAGCTCKGPGLKGQPLLLVELGRNAAATDAQTLDFGHVHVGLAKTVTIQVVNTGSIDFAPNISAVSGDANVFTIAPAGDLPSIAGQASAALMVTFKPKALKSYTGTFAVTCNGCAETDITLVGSGSGECILQVAPLQVVFPPAMAGTMKASTLTLKNTGAADCQLSLKLDPASDAAFTLKGGAVTGKLKAGMSYHEEVDFVAPSSGSLGHNGTLLVDSSDGKSPHQRVPLTASNEDAGYASTPWPKWHRTSNNSGLSYVDTSGTSGALVWKRPIGAAAQSVEADAMYLASPVIGLEGVVYQMGFGSSLTSPAPFVALKPDGTEKWRVMLTSPEPTCAESTPTVAADGSVYVMVGGDGVSDSSTTDFYHLAAADGHTLWSIGNDTDGFDSAPAISPDGTLYVVLDDTQQVFAFKNDQQVWTATVSMAWPETFSGALMSDGTSFWSAQGDVSALAGDGSHELWHVTLANGSNGKASPAVGPDGTVYVAEPGGGLLGVGGGLTVYALDPHSGTTKWQASGSGENGTSGGIFGSLTEGFSSPAMLPDGGVVVGGNGGLHAFANGQERWLFKTGAIIGSPAVGADGTTYVGSSDGNLYAVDSSGNLRWKYAIGAPVNSSPAIGGDGTIYAMADDGYLYAVR